MAALRVLSAVTALMAVAILGAAATEVTFQQITADKFLVSMPEGNSVVRCFRLYSKDDVVGGKQDAAIELVLESPGAAVTSLFFNHREFTFGYTDPDTGAENLLCTAALHTAGHCGVSNVGEVIVTPVGESQSSLARNTLNPTNSITDLYVIPKRDEYCVAIAGQQGVAQLTLYMEYPYGKLPAQEYPLMPFYGILALCYLVVGILWAIWCIYFWRVLLQVQNFISGVIFLCIFDMALRYGYYTNYNTFGVPSMPLLTIAVIVSAGRVTASLSALLVVCLGYGLVKPTLGEDGKKVFILGFLLFIFVSFFDASTRLETPTTSAIGLLSVFLTAITLSIYIIAILSGLSETLAKLMVRHQTEKTRVYVLLKRIILTAVVIFGFLFLVSVAYQMGDHTDNWHLAWMNEGSFAILNFFIVVSIMYLWRPTANNLRYGLGNVDTADEELGEQVVTGSGLQEKVKSRRHPSRSAADEEDENLRWVEENVPVLEQIEDIQIVAADEQESVRMLHQERSKLN